MKVDCNLLAKFPKLTLLNSTKLGSGSIVKDVVKNILILLVILVKMI